MNFFKLALYFAPFCVSTMAHAEQGDMGARHQQNVDVLNACLDTETEETSMICSGLVNAQCDSEIYGQSRCWTEEALAWDDILFGRQELAVEYLSERMDEEFARDFQKAQEAWETSRALDCKVAFIEPYEEDAGEAKCLALEGAARVVFIETMIIGAEFDG